MYMSTVLGLISLLISLILNFAAPLTDVSLCIFRGAQGKEEVLRKRKIFQDNSHTPLQQISLSSLVADVEKNIFASAVNLNSVLTDKNATAPGIKVKNNPKDDVNNKYQTLTNQERRTDYGTRAHLATTARVNFQTTKANKAIHTVIDRMAIKPLPAELVLLTIFDFKQVGMVEQSNKDNNNITKIRISQTDITSSTTGPPDSSNILSTTNFSISSSTIAAATTPSTEVASKSVTILKNIEHLKDAEEALRQKVAEIEAEPVILSARV